MADKSLFTLDTEGRWRLAYDRQQWIIQRRKGPPRPSNVVPGRASGWMAVSYVGGKKATLDRLFREKGIVLTAEAQTRFDALPDQFLAFLAEIDSSRPYNARTGETLPSDDLEYPQKDDEASARVSTVRRPKAA